MEYNMTVIEKVKAELVNTDITEDVCIDIYQRGSDMQAYALWLAKTKVHAESQTGWAKFCKKVGTTIQNANRVIEFYIAKSESIGSDSLPNKEGAFRALPKGTVEEKADFYEEVKELTGKEEPTALEISLVKKLAKPYPNQADKADVVKLIIENASPAVKKEIDQAIGKRGVTVGISMIGTDATEEEIIDELQNKKKLPQNFEDCREMNKQLREENRRLKEKVAELERNERADQELHRIVAMFYNISQNIINFEEDAEYMQKMVKHATPQMQNVVKHFGDIIDGNIDAHEIKARYRELAKKYHPDHRQKEGDDDMMVQINEAYTILKGMLNGRN